MKIDLTEEEREFLLRVCTRAKNFVEMGIIPKKFVSEVMIEADLEKLHVLINKLSEEKNEK